MVLNRICQKSATGRGRCTQCQRRAEQPPQYNHRGSIQSGRRP